MKSNFDKLGGYIHEVDIRNKDLRVTRLLGVSISKVFIESIANLIGTDMHNYKVVTRNQFAYGPVTSRNGEKVSIALLDSEQECIISSSYTVFEIIDTTKLLPKYLMLWFKRPEFDRYARFHSHGSVREIFGWDELCNVELPIPTLQKQKEIVDAYEAIESRIQLKRQINDNLEAQALAAFHDTIAPLYSENRSDIVPLNNICEVRGGKRLPVDCDLLEQPTNHPYIRVRDISDSRYVCLTNQFSYIDEETYSAISRYIVETDDIVISIVGTIGLLGKIHPSLNGANLTENCVRLTKLKRISPDYLYYTLLYKKLNKEIELLTVGAVQAKLPLYNIQSIPIVIPNDDILRSFQDKIVLFNKSVEVNMAEIQSLSNLRQLVLLHMI